MVLLTVQRLIGNKRGEFVGLGEPQVRSFASEDKAGAWLDWEDKRGIANWEKYAVVNAEEAN